MSKLVLIVARSGRQLAEAANAGGYLPIVIDFFGDTDTEAVCVANVVISPDTGLRFDPQRLLAALTTIRSGYGPMPLVWGSGWEGQPHLLAALAQTWPTVGCQPGALFAVNDPRFFSQILCRSEIPHPSIATGCVPTRGPWLLKRRGSCGGFGITRLGSRRFTGQREYLQRELRGTHLSAAFLVGRNAVSVLGVCEAFNLQPTDDLPFRFSAAVAAPRRFKGLQRPLTQVIENLATSFALRGLCGIDFVVDESGQLKVIELNARPPATFDLLAERGHVFQVHMKSDTQAYGPIPIPEQICAMAVCYAEHPLIVSKTLNWPDWVADRPRVGTALSVGMPICSITAAAATIDESRKLLVQRFSLLMGEFKGPSLMSCLS
jgi:predicted ATP-grasp superfamily ATP-dependent carboligase